MASAALSRPQTTVLPFTDSPCESAIRANDLCNELLAHMLECEVCLDPAQPECAVCMSLQSEIRAQGGPAAGVVFAF
jgi:hypothetical protein